MDKHFATNVFTQRQQLGFTKNDCRICTANIAKGKFANFFDEKDTVKPILIFTGNWYEVSIKYYNKEMF